MASSNYSLNWNEHSTHLKTVFGDLLKTSEFVDVTLSCEGQKVQAHKVLLSACSPYFRDIFKDLPCQQTIVILHGIQHSILMNILHYIYNGEVCVESEDLDTFLRTAKSLQITGLYEPIRAAVATEVVTKTEAVDKKADLRSISPTVLPSSPEKRVKRPRAHDDDEEPNSERQEHGNSLANSFLVSGVKTEAEPIYESPREHAFGEDETLADDIDLDETNIDKTKHPPPAIREHVKMRGGFSEESLTCNTCSKIFSHPYSLHHHKAVHSGGTQCHICNAVLSRKYNLKMHLKARHNIEYNL